MWTHYGSKTKAIFCIICDILSWQLLNVRTDTICLVGSINQSNWKLTKLQELVKEIGLSFAGDKVCPRESQPEQQDQQRDESCWRPHCHCYRFPPLSFSKVKFYLK